MRGRRREEREKGSRKGEGKRRERGDRRRKGRRGEGGVFHKIIKKQACRFCDAYVSLVLRLNYNIQIS